MSIKSIDLIEPTLILGQAGQEVIMFLPLLHMLGNLDQ